MPRDKIQKAAAPVARRKRRSTEEVLDRILEAARQEFENNGYVGAKTAEIAKKADVAEALIFSNFGSKDKLFQEAIFRPLQRHFVDFGSMHSMDDDDDATRSTVSRQYIAELQAFISKHSRMIMTLFVERAYNTERGSAPHFFPEIEEYLSIAAETRRQYYHDEQIVESAIATRVSFATIMACAIFKDWLFPPGFADDRLIAAVIRNFVMAGMDAGTGDYA